MKYLINLLFQTVRKLYIGNSITIYYIPQKNVSQNKTKILFTVLNELQKK